MMHKYALTLAMVAIAITCTVLTQEATAQSNAQSQITALDTAIEQAFNAVLKAEQAGANVTGLINRLNDAAEILAQARNAYRLGDSATALSDADLALTIAKEVELDSNIAIGIATESAQTTFWITTIVSIAVALVFVLMLFFTWRLLKQRYIKSLLNAKVEVIDQ